MTPRLAIGIDVGGTTVKAAVVSADGRIHRRIEQPTRPERGPSAVIADLADIVRRLLAGASPASDDPESPTRAPGTGGDLGAKAIVAIGLATPGPLDLRGGRIVHAANLPQWKDVPIRDALQRQTGLAVVLENDANAAAYGEFAAGAGRGCTHLVMLTLGTGVGGGVISDGRLLHGHFDNAGELGHMIVVPGGLPCPCGQRGCLERYASADAVARRGADAGYDGLRQEAGSLRAEDVARRAREADPHCRRVWDEACRYLAVACVNIQHAYNPERIILGGGLSLAGDFLLDGVKRHLGEQTWKLHDDVPEIVLAQLGADAGVIGAAALAMSDSVA